MWWLPNTLAQTPLLLGEHEALLANTGIARLGSSAAAYYNPAGLSAIEHSKISASGTLFQNSVRELSGSVNAYSNTFQSVPTQLSTVGVRGNLHYAFSVFNIRDYDYTVAVAADVGSGLGTLPARIKSTGTSLLVGPSLALSLTPELSIGASLFLQKDDDYLNTVVRLDRTGASGQAHFLGQSEIVSSTYMLVPIVGASYQVSADTSLGVRLTAPSAAVSGHRHTTSQRVGYTLDNAGTAADLGTPTSTLSESAKSVRPVELAVGVAQIFVGGYRLFVDGAYSLHTTYGPTASSDDVTLSDAFGVSAGVELGESSSRWAAGLLFRQNIFRDNPEEVGSFKGVTAGYSWATEHLDSGLGAGYIFGSGSNGGESNTLSNVSLLITSTYKF